MTPHDPHDRGQAAGSSHDPGGEARVQRLLANLSAGVVVHAADSTVLQANAAASRMLGLSDDQMKGRTAVDPYWCFIEDDQSPMPLHRFPVQQVIATGQPVRNLVLGIRRPDLPLPVWVLVNAYPELQPDGQLDSVVVTFSDITEIKQTEHALMDARSDLQATLEAIPDLLFEIDADGRYLSWNSPRHHLLYAPPDQFLGRTVQEVLPAPAAHTLMQAVAVADQTGFSGGLQYRLTLPDGERSFELSVARKRNGMAGRPCFVVLARDITERLQAQTERLALENQLREAQRMESLGTLAGGIAHDFNNILAAILGNVALAREEARDGQPVDTSLDQIQKAAQRARKLVQQILSFSRRDPLEFAPIPLVRLIEETVGMMRAVLPAGVRLETALADPRTQVMGNSTQLQQVLMNLCTNAWQAMPQAQGVVEVGFEILPAELPGREPMVHLWVRDDGSGMDEATRLHAFDPFFTTKPPGQGTGLGLSVVHGIVKAHGGTIELSSVPGRGTTFHIHLRGLSDAMASDTAPGELHLAHGGDAQRVLYIDDDASLAATVQRLLSAAGFAVQVETHAATALQRWRDAPHLFDAVVTDFNMPGMSGLDIARHVLAARPATPFLIITGLVSDELQRQASAVGVAGLIPKQDLVEALPDALSHLLDGDRELQPVTPSA